MIWLICFVYTLSYMGFGYGVAAAYRRRVTNAGNEQVGAVMLIWPIVLLVALVTAAGLCIVRAAELLGRLVK